MPITYQQYLPIDHFVDEIKNFNLEVTALNFQFNLKAIFLL